MKTELDHIVVGAASLQEGVAYIEDELGVAMPKGGKHPAMGTHNHLMQLGNDVFLEVIAIDPKASAPLRPRWYGLDDPYIRAQLAKRPHLLTWVVNTTDMAGVRAKSPFSFGQPTVVSRGDLSWIFGVPDDGRLLACGMLPYLIQWQTDVHPAGGMADRRCRLKGVDLYHPHIKWLSEILAVIDAERLVTLHRLRDNAAPRLDVRIETPTGIKTLRSCI